MKLNYSDGVLLAAIPAAGYLVAYMYEMGYCRYFSIPYDFISIDRQVIVSSVLAVLALFATFHWIIDFVRKNLTWMPGPVGRVFLRISLAIAIVVGLSVVGRATYLGTFLACAFVAGPVIVGNLLLPLVPTGASSSYVERVALELSEEDARGSIWDIYSKALGANVAAGVGFFYLVCLSAYIIGGYTAKSKVRFLTIPDSSEVVLVRSNSEFLVAAYDSSQRKIKAEVRLVPLDSKFRIADIGPLAPALSANPN